MNEEVEKTNVPEDEPQGMSNASENISDEHKEEIKTNAEEISEKQEMLDSEKQEDVVKEEVSLPEATVEENKSEEIIPEVYAPKMEQAEEKVKKDEPVKKQINFSEIKPLDDFDWNSIFENVGWFHFTGITPALSDELASICLKACQTAQEKGLIVSCDLNYRNKLWSREKACSVMSELCQYVDVCIANEEDATDVFGIKASNTELTAGKLDQESYLFVAKELIERFHFSYVAITLRKSISANDNNWAAMLFNGKDAFYSREYPVHIVDRVGGGDSFGAGLIYSFLQNDTEQNIIEFAVAASCLKHSIEGDYNMVSVAEVWKLANGDGSGRVLR